MNLVIPGQLGIAWPRRLGATIAAVVSHPDYRQFGLFHLPDLNIIWINSTTLNRVIDLGLFRSGNYYFQLVYAVNAIGLKAVDIEYTIPQNDG